MPEKTKNDGFTPQEHFISILPAVLAGILILLATTITALVEYPTHNRIYTIILYAYGVAGTIYLAFFYAIFVSSIKKKPMIAWINAILGGLSLGLLTLILPDEMDVLLGLLMIVATISAVLVTGRAPAYFIVISATIITIIVRFEKLVELDQWAANLGMALVALISIETIQQLKYLASKQINRLKIINEFSRQIASSLDTQQVTTLLNAAIQNALEADTYYVGMLEGDEILLHLFYDDGEYFQNVRAKLEGTLSGWVIRSQKGLFLPNLSHDVQLAGVKTVIIGKQKTSLSWMGVPMQGEFFKGVIAIASYHPNAFDRSDMELLSNLTQHATLALDNTLRHALVEEQAHMDSLTGVYNHGHFLKVLERQAETARAWNRHLSVIMLDIDFFKQYNDAYGHLAGDEILTKLCDTIRSHIKRVDAVGRWGGEEFAISLPNTSGAQAMQVADRIRETMAGMNLQSQNQETIPVPTVSQGIAEFPSEADEIFKLIDLADHRLYIAKERGRNQVEPDMSHWEQLENQIGHPGLFPHRTNIT
jgi:diguanylate cyclase (GGDEF)-like protein